jgi:hypothetical protein
MLASDDPINTIPKIIVRLYISFSIPLLVLLIFDVFEYKPDSCCWTITKATIPNEVISWIMFKISLISIVVEIIA